MAAPTQHLKTVMRSLEVPDAISGQPSVSGEPLPVQVWARVKTVRDVANALLPQPITIERALLRGQHNDVQSYLTTLAPFFQHAQHLEAEIIAANARGSGALLELANARAEEWGQFLQSYAAFAHETRDVRERLHLTLDDGETVRLYERVLIDPLSVPFSEVLRGWEVDAPAGTISPEERQRRTMHMQGLEAAVRQLDLPALFTRARHTQPADQRILMTQPIRPEDWRASHPWEKPDPAIYARALLPERQQPPPEPATASSTLPRTWRDATSLLRRRGVRPRSTSNLARPSLVVPTATRSASPSRTWIPSPLALPPSTPRLLSAPLTHLQVADALVEARRSALLLELRRQMSPLALLRRAQYTLARSQYLEALEQRAQLGAARTSATERAAVEHEALNFLGGMHLHQRGTTNVEACLHRLSLQWREAPLWMKLGLGATTVAASVVGGTPALVGAGTALVVRGLGALSLVDAVWQRGEAALLRRRVRSTDGLCELGSAAWRLEWTSAGSRASAALQEREKAAARTIEQGIRSQLRSTIDLVTLVDGAARAARMRPLHLLGKLGLAAAATVVVSSETARALFERTRLGLSRLLGFSSPTPAPLLASPSGDPTSLHAVPPRPSATQLPSRAPSFPPSPTPTSIPSSAPSPALTPSATPSPIPPPVPYQPSSAPLSAALVSNHHAPSPLHLTFVADGVHDCPDRLLRIPVLQEFARQGVDLDQLARADQGRVLNATANLTRSLRLGDAVVPGQSVNLPPGLLRSTVSRSLGSIVPGAESYASRVQWPAWIERATQGARAVRSGVRVSLERVFEGRT